MKRVLRRPSPAMVIAIVALIAALGGTAVGAAFVSKKQAKKIAANQVNKLAPGLSVASAKSADNAANATNATKAANSDALGGKGLRGISQWVSFGSAGNVVDQSGGITVTKLAATGRYRVNFPTSIADCLFNVTPGIVPAASDGSDFAEAMAMIARSSTNSPNAVQIEMADPAGVEINEPGHVTVQC